MRSSPIVDGVELRPGDGAGDDPGGGVSAGSRGRVYGGGLPPARRDGDAGVATDPSELCDCGGESPAGVTTGGTSALTGFLENPGPNSLQSGIGVLSGWVCEAEAVEIALGHLGRQGAAYGTERADTEYTAEGEALCGDTDNGFGLLFNWNLLGDGEHEVVAYVDGEELGRATVRVTTLGAEFLRGAEGECVVDDFPGLDQTVTLEWQQNSQNFVITDVE